MTARRDGKSQVELDLARDVLLVAICGDVLRTKQVATLLRKV